ncbi:hypothetical protein [Nocardia arizonensis]|uniref:hypothetical protein n=1 Tax=Nocardia arizonensis TaxID=1141647 RepID=UPI000AD1A579|nr:hypothetical protein [Nocardia arizonensis]
MDTTLWRLSAIAGIACGGSIALAGALEAVIGHKVVLTQLLNGGSGPLGIGLLIGLYLWQRHSLGRFGLAAFVVQFLGFGYFAGVAYVRNAVLVYLDRPTLDALLDGPARYVFLATAVLALTGIWLFGAALWRAAPVPKIAVALYVIGLSGLCLTFLLPVGVVRTGHVLGGTGMIWLSITLLRDVARSRPAADLPHTAPAPA